ncbi:3254_t:CDS:2 [Ambispora leptoticha]|uniref:3254_t:CDS:1 n=1 Tax=Ambispora leptoticha TaxID=144679 RepID=A0A9N9AW77_9GLOM|nr:3254_t:CDS:2 [Ambispora leptoticha]
MDPWIKVCIRTGHNTARYSVIQDGMVIDVSGMNGIFIDTAVSRRVCDDVGIAGFSSYGYTAIKHGMACDNIIKMTMVKANGKIKASEGKDPQNILWATKDQVEGTIPLTARETKRCAYIEKQLTQNEYQEIAPEESAFVYRRAYFDIFVDSFWIDDSNEQKAAA